MDIAFKFSFILSHENSTATLYLPLCTGRAPFFFTPLAADIGECYFFLTEAEDLLLNCTSSTVFRINVWAFNLNSNTDSGQEKN